MWGKPVDTSFYQCLHVEPTAGTSEIRESYRTLVLRYHPDKGGYDEDFKSVKRAYETLSNGFNRALYDALGENYRYHVSVESKKRELIGSPIVQHINVPLLQMMKGGKLRHSYRRQCGHYTSVEELDIDIPRCSPDGKTLILAGKGNMNELGHPYGLAGDLMIVLAEQPHSHFYRRGNCLFHAFQTSLMELLWRKEWPMNLPDQSCVLLTCSTDILPSVWYHFLWDDWSVFVEFHAVYSGVPEGHTLLQAVSNLSDHVSDHDTISNVVPIRRQTLEQVNAKVEQSVIHDN